MTDPADALRDLADALDGGGSVQPGPGSHRPESPIANHPPTAAEAENQRPEAPPSVSENDPALASASALAELSGAMSAAYDPGLSSQARQRRLAKPDAGMMQFRAAAIPVLITVGLVMSALGVWGILVMAGNTTLPKADEPDAQRYAVLALVGGMVGILLFAGAGFFLFQYLKDKKKLEAYEEAKAAQRRG